MTVVDRAPYLDATGQNIDITGSARRVIDKMGLTAAVRAKNTTEAGTQFIGPDGKPFALLPREEGKASPTSEFEILRGDLAAVLYEAAKDHPRITWLFSTVVEDVLENSDTGVKVRLSNGQVSTFDLLCSADGQWSKTRKMTFPAASVGTVDKNLYVCYWTMPRHETDDRYWNIYMELGSRNINIRPDPHGTQRVCVARMPLDEQHKREWEETSRCGDKTRQKDLVRKEFADAGWITKRCVDSLDTKEADDFYFQAIKQIKLKGWSHGRIVCVGDAAYAPTGITGEGALDRSYRQQC